MLKPVAGPFSTILSLEEQPIAAGDNYIITTLSKYKKQVNSLSVLAYNVDNELRENLMAADNIQQVVDYIADYGIEQEFLLRCIGLTGKFRVSRYFLSKENCSEALLRDDHAVEAQHGRQLGGITEATALVGQGDVLVRRDAGHEVERHWRTSRWNRC